MDEEAEVFRVGVHPEVEVSCCEGVVDFVEAVFAEAFGGEVGGFSGYEVEDGVDFLVVEGFSGGCAEGEYGEVQFLELCFEFKVGVVGGFGVAFFLPPEQLEAFSHSFLVRKSRESPRGRLCPWFPRRSFSLVSGVRSV